jgi:pimeloyl-ACP methyl ester carboxylesterase
MRIGEYATHMDVQRHDGLAYELMVPQGWPCGRVVVLHGAGSCKENHRDFAALCAAGGLAAIVFDQRGHGASDGALDGRAIEDVATMASLVPGGEDGPLPLFLRGSSMGGFLALAAAARTGAAGVVAICPAGRELLLGGLRSGRGCCSCTPRATTACRARARAACTPPPPAAGSSRCPAEITTPRSTILRCRPPRWSSSPG